MEERQTSEPADNEEHNPSEDEDIGRYCEILVAETIIALSRLLSNVVLDNLRALRLPMVGKWA
jgi:hypothetical protein